MGAQGIRRRKKVHHLPKVDDSNISEGDVGRLFGRFSWGGYSPAGAGERFGFFLRQWKRNGLQGVWAFFVDAKWVFATFGAVVVTVFVALHLL